MPLPESSAIPSCSRSISCGQFLIGESRRQSRAKLKPPHTGQASLAARSSRQKAHDLLFCAFVPFCGSLPVVVLMGFTRFFRFILKHLVNPVNDCSLDLAR